MGMERFCSEWGQSVFVGDVAMAAPTAGRGSNEPAVQQASIRQEIGM